MSKKPFPSAAKKQKFRTLPNGPMRILIFPKLVVLLDHSATFSNIQKLIIKNRTTLLSTTVPVSKIFVSILLNRDEDEEKPTSFEVELATMDYVDDDFQDEVLVGEGPEQENTSVKWNRAPVPPLNPQIDTLSFQQIEIDHYIGKPLSGMPGSKLGPVPIMRMFGVTEQGNSVCCHVHGFCPYLFVSAPSKFTNHHCKPFKEALDQAVKKDMKSNSDNIQEAILAVELVSKQSMYGYTGEEKLPFLKITVAVPRLIAPCKRLLEQNTVYTIFNHHYKAFESNIDFDIRFMVDTSVVGCSWIELTPKNWKIRGQYRHNLELTSRCQLEVDVAWDAFIAHTPEGEWSKLAPFRILSFDIECAGREGVCCAFLTTMVAFCGKDFSLPLRSKRL